MAAKYFAHIGGHAEPVPLSDTEYAELRKDLNGSQMMDRFHSVTVDGKVTFSFRTAKVSMIEERNLE
ncbi:MAG: hypothetical protein WB615_01255 [Candidatus Tumulicola sp.]